MQLSKIKQLGIHDDFENIFIIDPLESDLTKTDIFRKILTEKQLKVEEVLVVGDDLHSELKAARELGIDSVLYDHSGVHPKIQNQPVISDFRNLKAYVME